MSSALLGCVYESMQWLPSHPLPSSYPSNLNVRDHDSDSHGSESDDDNPEDGLSESDYDSDSVDDTAPVEIAVNLEFSVQDIADA